jgi:dynein heavy chain 2
MHFHLLHISRWQRAKPSTDAKEMTQDVADKILEEISDWNQELATLVELAATLTKDTKHFDMTTPNFSALEEAAADIKTHQSGWSLYDEYNNQLRAMTTEAWVAFRAKINNFDNFLMKWSKKLKDQNKDIVYDYISKEVKDHKLIWPVLQKVTGELFEMEHWKLMFAKLKFAPDVTLPTLTLGHFLAAREAMMAEQKFLDHLAARARGEVAIREAVDEIRLWAETTEFSLLEQPTADGKGTWLIKEWKDLFTKISDQQSLVGSLKESPYYPPFADQCKEFDEKLSLLDGALHEINQIQRKWVYLEPIFGRGALPQEAARFKRIDTEFRGIMDDLAESANVMNMANVPNLRDTVKTLLDQLERCQKALNDFLEEKRNKFPRFYFLGDDDLLEILGQSQNPAVIQNHLKKLFAGIHQVVFSEDKKLIVAMRSSEGEEVTLSYEVKVTDKVEVWLLELSDCMQETLAQLTVQCAKEGPEYDKYASQVLCLAEMVNYTMDVEKAIRDNKLSSLHSKLKKTLGDLTSVDVNNSKLLRLKVQALVMDLIHNIEVVQLLLDNKVGNVDNWLWQKQLRFYFDEQGRVQVVMSSASFNYTYEYQGNAGKLVHTPLTDKCYLVLTQGMHLGYGGNPYGPAGTGKTESVKALGGAMGRQVLVFNCDEGIDFQSMGRIFTGLVKSGAWGCFDEFNRLKEDQLSAVSQQIQVIQAALKNGDADCDLLGKTIEVNPNAAIFVTMNPASKEYGGRSKLPHNLKQLFRAVAMSVPDNALIAETILYSCGFKFASDVGHKLVQVYQLARQLLTPQKHYDWGLRALKTILGHGGQLIQQEKKNVQNNGGEITLALEQKLIIGSLKINTLSKLTYDDAIRFDGLINDVFPGVAAEDIDYADLESAIRGALDELHLLQVDTQIKKILQLNEALHQRMGVVVVGPSGCGKTTMLNVLHLAHKKLGQTVVRHVMNPKALEREKLLGHMDHDTREWFDGVLTASARQVVKETQETHSWIVCDGDIDPEWVESLNSVLDDNRLLTMPNGERIAFGSNVNFIFETHDLQFASPATISRMGMIFLSEENTDIRSLVVAWLRLQPEKMRERLGEWMDDLFYKALDWVMDEEAFVVGSTKVGAVTTALSHLLTVTCKAEFVTGLIRGMGSNLAIAKRNALALEIFEWSGERPPERQAPLDCYWSPKDKSFVQYTYKESTIATEDLSMSSPPIIETVDVQRNRAMIKPWLDNASPFVVVGPEGCGKTLLLTHMFKELKSTSVVTLHCSAQTQSMHVIRKLDEGCGSHTTKTGRVLRPREGERLILFLKDLNLPKPDEYDTIQMIAFLQQLVTYQGFHDDNLDWVGIEGVQIVACMNPATSVGRSELSTRFTAIVNVMYMTYPDHDQLASVYTCFLKAVLTAAPKLQDKSWRQEASVRRLAGAMVGTYEKIKKTFSSDDHRHYLFNPRDMTQWTLGLLRYDLASQNLLDVWTYESYRLFCDRLVNRDSTNKFEAIIADALKTNFKYEVKLTNLYYTTLEENEEEEEEKDQAAKKEEESEREEVPPVEKEMGALLQRMDSKEFKALVAGALYNYERENKELRMLLFPEILDHIAFEDRVLSRPGGSLLLVGDSGVGRRTATNLVCYMLKIAMYSPNISLNYTKKSFHTDIKEVLRIAGVENRKVCFFLEDHQIVFEGMLEDINSLLSASQVPGLYQSTEIEALLGPIKEEWSMDGRFRTPWAFFVDRIRTNVHVVLSFDPKNPKFGMRCESNPAIYNKCTILWMGRWSKYGMLQVAHLFASILLCSLLTISLPLFP